MTAPELEDDGVVSALARAKINLHLAVGRRRQDGYHEVSSAMQSVDLADTVTLAPSGAVSVSFLRGGGFAGDLPAPPDLVEKALEQFAAEVPGSPPLAAEVTKVIPMASGLAGGSADAAAALLGASTLLDGAVGRERLEAMCRRLGADVTFCLRGGTALVEGWGNLVSPMACPHRLWWVLGISDFPLGAGEVYQRFDELTPAPPSRPDRPIALAKALVSGHPKQIGATLRNDLEAPAFDLAPGLADQKAAMLTAGAVAAILTGSGPTIVGLCRNEAHGEEVLARAAELFDRAELVASAEAGAEVVARRG